MSYDYILYIFLLLCLHKLLWDLRDNTNVDVDQQILTKLSVMAPRILQVSRNPLKKKLVRLIDDCADDRQKKGNCMN